MHKGKSYSEVQTYIYAGGNMQTHLSKFLFSPITNDRVGTVSS